MILIAGATADANRPYYLSIQFQRDAAGKNHDLAVVGSMAMSAGSVTFILLATSPIALMKQADHPAANSCSGFVPVPAAPARRMGLGGVPHLDAFLGLNQLAPVVS